MERERTTFQQRKIFDEKEKERKKKKKKRKKRGERENVLFPLSQRQRVKGVS